MCQVSWHEGHYVCCGEVSERSACSSSQSSHFQAHVWTCRGWLWRFTLPHWGSLAQSWQCLEACLLFFATRSLLLSVKGASKASKVSLTRFGSVDSASSQISALTLTNSTWNCKDVIYSSRIWKLMCGHSKQSWFYGRNSCIRATMFISLT